MELQSGRRSSRHTRGKEPEGRARPSHTQKDLGVGTGPRPATSLGNCALFSGSRGDAEAGSEAESGARSAVWAGGRESARSAVRSQPVPRLSPHAPVESPRAGHHLQPGKGAWSGAGTGAAWEGGPGHPQVPREAAGVRRVPQQRAGTGLKSPAGCVTGGVAVGHRAATCRSRPEGARRAGTGGRGSASQQGDTVSCPHGGLCGAEGAVLGGPGGRSHREAESRQLRERVR